MKRGSIFLLLNNLIIAILVAIRLSVFGWVLLAFGFVVLLPLTILHLFATNKGIKYYMAFSDNERFMFVISLFSFVVFMLFQFEMDDRAGYLVIEAFVRRYFIGFDDYWHDYSNLSVAVSITSGLSITVTDILLLLRIKRLKVADTTPI